jgi:hypothetical protein
MKPFHVTKTLSFNCSCCHFCNYILLHEYNISNPRVHPKKRLHFSTFYFLRARGGYPVAQKIPQASSLGDC